MDLRALRLLEQSRLDAVPVVRAGPHDHDDHVARHHVNEDDHEQCDVEDCPECAKDALVSVILWAASRSVTLADLADDGADVGELLRHQARVLRNILIFEGDVPEAALPLVNAPKPSHLKLVE